MIETDDQNGQVVRAEVVKGVLEQAVREAGKNKVRYRFKQRTVRCCRHTHILLAS